MINVPNWTISCGVREINLDKTSAPKEIIAHLSRKRFKPAVYHFAETRGKKETNTQGEKLVKYIKKRKLGKILTSAEMTTRRTTKAWMWVVNREALINYKEKPPTPLTPTQLAEQNRLTK